MLSRKDAGSIIRLFGAKHKAPGAISSFCTIRVIYKQPYFLRSACADGHTPCIARRVSGPMCPVPVPIREKPLSKTVSNLGTPFSKGVGVRGRAPVSILFFETKNARAKALALCYFVQSRTNRRCRKPPYIWRACRKPGRQCRSAPAQRGCSGRAYQSRF